MDQPWLPEALVQTRQWLPLLLQCRGLEEGSQPCRDSIRLFDAVVLPKDSGKFEVYDSSSKKTFYLKASSTSQKQKWIDAIEISQILAISAFQHFSASSSVSDDDEFYDCVEQLSTDFIVTLHNNQQALDSNVSSYKEEMVPREETASTSSSPNTSKTLTVPTSQKEDEGLIHPENDKQPSQQTISETPEPSNSALPELFHDWVIPALEEISAVDDDLHTMMKDLQEMLVEKNHPAVPPAPPSTQVITTPSQPSQTEPLFKLATVTDSPICAPKISMSTPLVNSYTITFGYC